MTERTFSQEDQFAFAELSGDYNPLHLNEILARRLLFGRTVVHGIHLALWALECWCEGRVHPVELRTVKAEFLKPIGVGETVRCRWQAGRGDSVAVSLLVGDVVTTRLNFEWALSSGEQLSVPISSGLPERRDCREWSASDIQTAAGKLELWLDATAASRLFPMVERFLPAVQTSLLLATTRLVGTECPGLHSLYSQLSLTFGGVTESSLNSMEALEYSVAAFDPRFNLLTLNVGGCGMSGSLRAFLRPPPREQTSYNEVRKVVQPGEFSSQRALVVGGSRGLGEITAKLLAAGGADVRITYFLGSADARRVVEEIRVEGGTAASMELDVLDLQAGWVERLNGEWQPTHLYYFATGFIEAGVPGAFSADRLEKFCRYYVFGFSSLCNRLLPQGVQWIFYPSSVYVDAPPRNMREYSAAKAMGEALCAFLEQMHQGVAIYRPRLPRMATDQTPGVIPLHSADPMSVMLEHLRSLFRLAKVGRNV